MSRKFYFFLNLFINDANYELNRCMCCAYIQVGCPNCGFSFCTKCLKKTIEVPKCKNAVCKVCLSCYEKLLKSKPLIVQRFVYKIDCFVEHIPEL